MSLTDLEARFARIGRIAARMPKHSDPHQDCTGEALIGVTAKGLYWARCYPFGADNWPSAADAFDALERDMVKSLQRTIDASELLLNEQAARLNELRSMRTEIECELAVGR